jgi:hypothetical protein
VFAGDDARDVQVDVLDVELLQRLFKGLSDASMIRSAVIQELQRGDLAKRERDLLELGRHEQL